MSKNQNGSPFYIAPIIINSIIIFLAVGVETSDDSALEDVNYRRLSRVLNFDPFISNLTIGIDIIDSTTPVNVDFWVVLFNASNGAVQSPYGAARIQILDTSCTYCQFAYIHRCIPARPL